MGRRENKEAKRSKSTIAYFVFRDEFMSYTFCGVPRITRGSISTFAQRNGPVPNVVHAPAPTAVLFDQLV